MTKIKLFEILRQTEKKGRSKLSSEEPRQIDMIENHLTKYIEKLCLMDTWGT